MPKVVPVDYFLIHAPDTAMEAAIINSVLNATGHVTVTYRQAYEGWLSSKIAVDLYSALGEMRAFVFIGSPEFFKDNLLTEVAHEALAKRKAIFTTLTSDPTYPEWFYTYSFVLTSDSQNVSHGKNKLIEHLSRYKSAMQFVRKH